MKIAYSKAGKRQFLSKPEKFPTGTRFFYDFEGKPNIVKMEAHISYFADRVAHGYPFYPCVLSDKEGTFKKVKAECFEYADIIGFDLEKGNHSEQRVKTELYDKGIKPCLFYRTYSHRQGDNGDRNRIIFRLPYRITARAEYLLLCVLFRALYWDIDTSCIDTARIFFGTNNPKYRVDEEAVLDLPLFVEMALSQLAAYREAADEENKARYEDVINRLTHSSINCALDADGLPVISFNDDGKLIFEENTEARVKRIHAGQTAPELTDEMLSSGANIKKIPMPYWREKAMIEPLYRELVNGKGHYGYKKAMVLVSSYRFIDADDVKQDIFELLIENGHRFSNIQHTIEEAEKIWCLPMEKGSGYGCKPLSYAECDMIPIDTYNYPLTFLRNTKRTLELNRNARIAEDFKNLITEHDFTKYPKALILNGGMGLGKTYACIHDLKPSIDERYKKNHRIVFLTSRKASAIQIQHKYFTFIKDEEEQWKHPDGISVMSYHKFMMWMEAGLLRPDEFDVIIADEAQSTAHDTFARQMGGFLVWANEVYKGIVIWISANGRYLRKVFQMLEEQHGAAYNNHFKMLYETEGGQLKMRYDTSTIDFYSHSNIDYAIIPILTKANRENRVLVFLSSASKCFEYYHNAKKKGYRAAFWVSEYCSTELKEEYISEYTAEVLDEQRKVAITLHDAFMYIESERDKQNIMTLRDALLTGENYPEDVDIIFTTSALRESINISEESNVRTVITDSYDEVEVLQQRGRIRGDVETLIICPQRMGTATGIEKKIRYFETLFNRPQNELAEEYGAEIKAEQRYKGKTAYVLKLINDSGEPEYRVNYPAYFALKMKIAAFTEINPTTDKIQLYLDDVFGCLSSGNRVRIVYERETRRSFVVSSLRSILPKYKGLPLIGATAEALMKECEGCLRDYDGDTGFSMKLILKEARDAGFEIKEGQIGKKHQKMGYDVPLRTKFRYIV